MKKIVAFITGASRGLGKCLAEALAREGYCVYSGVRNLADATANSIPVHIDMRDEESLQVGVKQIIKEHGRIDLLINNAAIAYSGAVESMTLQEAQDLFNVNFFGAFRLTQLVLPYMRKQKSGKILFVSSILAVGGCVYMGMYSASKAALEAMAFDLAATVAKWNISVLVVQPGPMNTNIEIKHGSYFKDSQNPYLPYPNVILDFQDVEEAAAVILEKLKISSSIFRFQTNKSSEEYVAKHLKDPSGTIWLNEQKFLC